MRLESLHMLADADVGKVVVGILVFVIWGIASLASMVKKANEEARRRALARGPGVAAAPAAPVSTDQRMSVGTFAGGAAKRPPALPASILQRAQGMAKKKQPKKGAAKPVPPPIRAAAPVARAQPAASPATSRPVVERVAASAASSIARLNAGGAKAPAIRKWLVPGTLRKQFILTEVLRPPVALREER